MSSHKLAIFFSKTFLSWHEGAGEDEDDDDLFRGRWRVSMMVGVDRKLALFTNVLSHYSKKILMGDIQLKRNEQDEIMKSGVEKINKNPIKKMKSGDVKARIYSKPVVSGQKLSLSSNCL